MRVLAAVDRGTPRKQGVRLFGVSLTTVGGSLPLCLCIRPLP